MLRPAAPQSVGLARSDEADVGLQVAIELPVACRQRRFALVWWWAFMALAVRLAVGGLLLWRFRGGSARPQPAVMNRCVTTGLSSTRRASIAASRSQSARRAPRC